MSVVLCCESAVVNSVGVPVGVFVCTVTVRCKEEGPTTTKPKQSSDKEEISILYILNKKTTF